MGTKHTRLRIVNDTNTDIINTFVTGCANYDWDRGAGPHRNFQGVFIASKSSAERGEEITADASHCPFNMTLRFRDGTEDSFRIHQKYADGCCAGFERYRASHNLHYDRVEGNCLRITLTNTDAQLQNEKAEQLKKEGEAAMRQRQYHTAKQRFAEAMRLANQNATIGSINSAAAANVAAEEAYHKERAEQLKKEADAAMENSQYEAANDKYERALDSERNDETKREMEVNKATALNELAKAAFQEAWDFEADMSRDRSNAAKNMFNQAKARFQAARNLAQTPEIMHSLKIVDVKISGNRLFNEANELEKEAYRLFEQARESQVFDNYTTSQNKYKEALEKYKSAKEKFEEGVQMNDGRFEACVQIVDGYMQNVEQVIDDIDKTELKHNISKVNVDEEKKDKKTDEEKLNINTDLHEQIDVVSS